MKTIQQKTIVCIAFAMLLSGCGGGHLFQRTDTVLPTGETNVTYTVSTNALASIKAVSDVAASIPSNPFTGLLTGILGLSTVVLGGIARVKTVLANQHKTDLQTVARVIESLPDPVSNQVKAAVAERAGPGSTLDATIQSVL